MTTAITTADTIAYHRGRSRHFLDLVDDEIERGELEEACNKLWEAAVHAIKAVAEQRGWPHNTDAQLEDTVHRLVSEEGAPLQIWGQYMMATAFHQRFYGGPSDAVGIGYGKGTMAEFISTLERLG